MRRRSIAATVVGNFVEYFDWLAYGLFAPLFAKQFFPSSNNVTSLLGVYAVFAVGMLFRPLGGVLLGRLTDRRGRRPALMLSIGMMAAGSALIAAVPTYRHIGLAAPLLLLVARAVQGLSSGGEWPAAVTYLMELAPANRKCFYGSLFSMSGAAGALVAAVLGGSLTAWYGRAAMVTWGWRVPFMVGTLFGVILLLARRFVSESAVFQREVHTRPGRGSLRRVLGSYGRQVLLVVLFVGGLTAVIGTWTTTVPAIGFRLLPAQMFWVIALASGITIALQVPLGLLADRIGVPIFLAGLNIAFLVVGPIAYLGMTRSFANLVFAYGSGILYIACVSMVMPKVLAALFPADVRGVGIGLPHSTTTAVLGGCTPLLATYMADRGVSGWFIAAVMATIVLGWLGAELAGRRTVPAVSTVDAVQADEPPVARAA
jgi:MHS family alpha-ketoglutarate permease-like MFS transporter